MQGILLAYSAGIGAGTFQLHPGWTLLGAAMVSLLSLAVLGCRPPPRLRYCLLLSVAAAAGLLWHAGWAWQHLQQQLPRSLAGQDLHVQGRIVSFVQQQSPRQRFTFALSEAPGALAGRRVLLDYYGEQSLQAGQRWRLQVRLKRPHGFANPGSFDYEAWLFQQGIVARGYIREMGSALPDQRKLFSPIHWRQRLKSRLEKLDGLSQGPILQALVLGNREGIQDRHWQLFSSTGTNHLFVISGLHVGLVAFATYALVQFGGRWLCLPIGLLPRSQIAALAALVAALFYCLVAGFALPAQRAFIMLSAFMLGTLLRRRWPVSLRYLLALAGVLTVNPLAALSQGFWLSFIAVGSLLMATPAPGTSGAERPVGRYIRLALQSQWLVFIGLLIPLSQLTGQVSLIAPLVNVIAIPLVGLVIVPLSLLGVVLLTLMPAAGLALLAPADFLLGALLAVLQALAAGLAGTALKLLPASPVVLLVSGVACLLVLAPRCLPGRHLAVPLLLPLLFPGVARPPPGSVAIDFLDVGQGLAVLVRTRQHALLYDTGDRYSESFDLGEAVVTPVLRHFGLRRLDLLIISHGDTDHVGGAASVLRNFPTPRLLYGGHPAGLAERARPCRAGQDWRWDGVHFRVLGPLPGLQRSDENGLSCVLQVRVGELALLLTGDIDSAVERQLVVAHGEDLRSSLLGAPHHGSQTSSGYPFLKTVNADYVLVSAGYGNAFGHPAPAVLRRYRALRSEVLITAQTGMISFTLSAAPPIAAPGLYRRDVRRYWRHQVIDESADTVRYE